MPSLDFKTLRTLLQRKPEIVESRAIASIDYNAETEEMDVTFQGPPTGGAGTWRYSDVPVSVYADFQTALYGSGQGGQGRYFNYYIRDKYPSERIA